MGGFITAAVVGVAGIATNVVMSQKAAKQAKEMAKEARANQVADAKAYAEEQRQAQIRADNDALVAQIRADNDAFTAQTQQRLQMQNAIYQQLGPNAQAGYAAQNANSEPSLQIIVPAAMGVTAVALSIFALARRKQ